MNLLERMQQQDKTQHIICAFMLVVRSGSFAETSFFSAGSRPIPLMTFHVGRFVSRPPRGAELAEQHCF